MQQILGYGTLLHWTLALFLTQETIHMSNDRGITRGQFHQNTQQLLTQYSTVPDIILIQELPAFSALIILYI